MDGTVRLWDSASGEPKETLRGHEGPVTDVVFSPDGRRIASAGGNTVRIWDAATYQPAGVLRGHTQAPIAVAFDMDGALIATAGLDLTVRLWDARTFEQLAVLTHGSQVYSIALNPDGSRLATACQDNTIRLWDIATREEVTSLHGHDAYVHAVAFSPDGTRLVSGSGDQTIRIWDSIAMNVRSRADGVYVPPKQYLCYRAPSPIHVDGRLDDPGWQAILWTDPFVDIEGDGKPRPRYSTRAKMLWDDEHFYIAADLREPHIWATLSEWDSVIFHDNDFEVFIDPDGDNHRYAEFEINAMNTGWDLLMPIPYRAGGQAVNSWKIRGLKTAVHVDGTMNNHRDKDRGWSIEIAFPWKALAELWDGPTPPRNGDQWRVNFSRVQWRTTVVDGKYQKIPNRREDNWVWSPQGAVDMHRPEHWGHVQFSTEPLGQDTFRPDPADAIRHLLCRVFYAQFEFHEEHNRWANTIDELRMVGATHKSLAGPLMITPTERGYLVTAEVRLADGTTQRWQIGDDSRVWCDNEASRRL
jgi:hypothetical protein